MADGFCRALRHIRRNQISSKTAQPTGMQRFPAISGASVVSHLPSLRVNDSG